MQRVLLTLVLATALVAVLPTTAYAPVGCEGLSDITGDELAYLSPGQDPGTDIAAVYVCPSSNYVYVTVITSGMWYGADIKGGYLLHYPLLGDVGSVGFTIAFDLAQGGSPDIPYYSDAVTLPEVKWDVAAFFNGASPELKGSLRGNVTAGVSASGPFTIIDWDYTPQGVGNGWAYYDALNGVLVVGFPRELFGNATEAGVYVVSGRVWARPDIRKGGYISDPRGGASDPNISDDLASRSSKEGLTRPDGAILPAPAKVSLIPSSASPMLERPPDMPLATLGNGWVVASAAEALLLIGASVVLVRGAGVRRG